MSFTVPTFCHSALVLQNSVEPGILSMANAGTFIGRAVTMISRQS
jgi:hypothetical protein